MNDSHENVSTQLNKTANCLCSVHLKVDKELIKEGKVPSKCLGHGEECPCYVKESI